MPKMFLCAFARLRNMRSRKAGRARFNSLQLERLESREAPALYVWTGNSPNQNTRWSDPTNWLKDGQATTTTPGSGDEVEFNGTPAEQLRNSNVDTAFTIGSLKLKADWGAAIFIDADLDIAGAGVSSIASGMIHDLNNLRQVRFLSNDYGGLEWSGGGFDAKVEIAAGIETTISGTAEKKNLKRFDSSGEINWDGRGQITLGDDAQFFSRYAFNADIAPDGTSVIHLPNDKAFFVNLGSFTANVPTSKELVFSGLGWLQNYDKFTLTQGIVSLPSLDNRGDIELQTGTEFRAGNDIRPILMIPGDPSGDPIPAIRGPGKAVFVEDSRIELWPGTSMVENVADYSDKTTGNGNLLITGTYDLGYFDFGSFRTIGGAQWLGTGITRVGSAEAPNAQLRIHGSLEMSRRIENNRQVTWLVVDAQAGQPDIELLQSGSIYNNAGGVFDISCLGPLLSRINSNDNTGVLLNAGTIQTVTDQTIAIRVPYIPFITSPPIGNPILRHLQGQLHVNKELQKVCGIIENHPSARIAFLEGIDQSGGDIINLGEMEVTNGYLLSGGTITTSSVETDPVSFTADSVTQTGGTFTVNGTAPATLTVTGVYDFTGGEAELRPSPYSSPSSSMSFGELIVAAPSFRLAGATTADDGILVDIGGELELSGYDSLGQSIVANVTVHGLLDLTHGTRIIGNLVNHGVVHIGTYNSVSGPDMVTIQGNFTQTSGGWLKMDNPTGDSDFLTVIGTATLAGTLAYDGLELAAGMSLTLMSYGALSGTFDSLVAPPSNFPMSIWYGTGALGVRADYP